MFEPDSADKFDRFEMGLEILNKLESEQGETGSGNLGTTDLHTSTGRELNLRYALPTLEDILQDLAPLNANNLIIGVCEDGLPLLLNLSNPTSGSILILGDSGSGKTRLLASMLESVRRITSPRSLRIAGLTSSQVEWKLAATDPHSYRWTTTRGLEAGAIIHELVKICEQRRYGREGRNILVLAIDELSDLLVNLNAESIELLTWLINNGPESGVWTISTLDARQAASHSNVTSAFGTWLYGNIASNRSKISTAQIPEEISTNLVAGAQFCIQCEDEWLNVWIPSIG